MRKFIIVFLFLGISSAYGQFGWYTQNANSSDLVGGIHMFDNAKAIVVGFSGLMRTTINGGQNWEIRSTSISTNLHKVTFINNSIGTVIGELGVILYTSNGGTTWSSIASNTNSNLNDVRFTKIGGETTNTGFIAGSNGTILKSIDGGLNWSGLNSGTTQILTDVAFSDYSTGYAVGYNGTVIKTTNGGMNWSARNTGYTSINNFGVRFINRDTGIVVGGNSSFTGGSIFKTVDGGNTWQVKLYNFPGSINMVYYHNANTITVVGNFGLILKSYDTGETWTIQSNQSNKYLHDVDFSGPNVGIAVGKDGTIVKTTSGGLVSVSPSSSFIPEKFSLSQNYPNPFNPSTKINFDIRNSTFVSLKVFNMAGKEIKTLVNESITSGSYEITFDGSDLNSGVYFYKLTTNEFTETKKMILVK